MEYRITIMKLEKKENIEEQKSLMKHYNYEPQPIERFQELKVLDTIVNEKEFNAIRKAAIEQM